MEKKAVIQTTVLSKRYGETIAVNNLNLDIYAGEVFGLLGPNGAGKTTTILMLLGLTEPSAGSAKVLGHDSTREPIAIKRQVGYLPDNVGFYNDMTGFENLHFTGRLNGLSEGCIKERAASLLERVQMTDVAGNRVGTYSKGMKQRLAIADILMKDPKVIILDEPTLGIDPEGMRDLLALIRGLCEEDGRTVVISSHQLHQIQQICDRVGIFVKGRLIARGPIRALARKLNEDGYIQIEFGVSAPDEKLEAVMADLESVVKTERENNLFILTCTEDLRATLPRILAEHGYLLTHLRMRSDDLDEIYHRYFEKEGKPDGRGKEPKKNQVALPQNPAES